MENIVEIVSFYNVDSVNNWVNAAAPSGYDFDGMPRDNRDPSNLTSSHTIKCNINSISHASRTIIWYMVFIVYTLDAMVRVSTSLTIIAMIERRNISLVLESDEIGINNIANVTVASNQSYINVSSPTHSIGPIMKSFSIERIILDWFQINYSKNGFPWNEYQQGLILGSFYWGYSLTQAPGSLLVFRYGTKICYSIILLTAAIANFLIPTATYVDYRLLIALRFIQGLVAGATWSAMHQLIARWVPPDERSKFVSAYVGAAVGKAAFFPLFGLITSTLSWEWVYYINGTVALICFLFWKYCIYDSPSQHPRIDPAERDYITSMLSNTVRTRDQKVRIPWKDILSSRPLWMIVVSQWGMLWSVLLLLSQGPTYFKTIHNWNIQMSGLLSGLPYALKAIFSGTHSVFADYLIRRKKMTRTIVRKMSEFICDVVQGFCMLGLSFSGHNSTMAIVFYSLVIMTHGASTSGSLANIIDISPHFAGILLGMVHTITVPSGFITPYIVGVMTLNNQTAQQWQYLLLITSITSIVCGIVYVLLADANVQPWNNKECPEDAEEMEHLRS